MAAAKPRSVKRALDGQAVTVATETRRRHVPDLPQLHRAYETNYMALMKLLPAEGSAVRLYNVAQSLQFALRIVEDTRYTTLLEISQHNERMPAFLRSYMQVRLYHDARMAEVCVSQQISRLHPSYDYPNPAMHQRDEKERCNHFLSEWLRFCLSHGYSAEVLTYE